MKSTLIKSALAVMVVGGGYYAWTESQLDEDSLNSSTMKELAVAVPAPQKAKVATRPPVFEDRQALAVFADQLKGLYQESYFKKIQMAREVELDAEIATNMQKVREAGYTVSDGAKFTFNSQPQNGTIASDIQEDKDARDSGNSLDQSYYEARAVLSNIRLLMTDGKRGTFDLSGEFIDLAEGEELGIIKVESIDNDRGRAVVSSPKHGLTRTLVMAKTRYAMNRAHNQEGVKGDDDQTELDTETSGDMIDQRRIIKNLPPLSSMLLKQITGAQQ
tara:strand:- start:21624 stop:22448 length:825 start_codon:yes stop_codon:yes gene_type:complete